MKYSTKYRHGILLPELLGMWLPSPTYESHKVDTFSRMIQAMNSGHTIWHTVCQNVMVNKNDS
jgi:hypothetical protein